MRPDLTLPKYLAIGYLLVLVGVLSTVSVFIGLRWLPERVNVTQNGFRGTAMNQIVHPVAQRLLQANNLIPESSDPASDRKSTRLNSSHIPLSRMPSSA